MKVLNTSRVLVSSLSLLSYSNDVVEAFKSSPLDSRFQAGTTSAATKLDAASLALTFEEDLALTRQIIMDHEERSTTVSKEQFIQQMEELVKPTEEETISSATAEIIVEEVDVSVPYDAAARLAYASLENNQGISYETFQAQYLADAVALVKSKQPKKEVDISSPVAHPVASAEESTISEVQSAVDIVTPEKKSFLQPLFSWLWNQISSK